MSKRNNNKSTIFIDRQGGIIYAEFVLSSIILSKLSVQFFALPWAVGVVTFFPYVYLLNFLFFKFFLWRWFFSSVMSFMFGYMLFRFTELLTTPDDINAWIMGVAVFVFMLWVHRDEYNFESSAVVNYFDYH